MSYSVNVHRFSGSRLHSYSWAAFRMRIYEKEFIFGRSNPEFGAKLAIAWENKHV